MISVNRRVNFGILHYPDLANAVPVGIVLRTLLTTQWNKSSRVVPLHGSGSICDLELERVNALVGADVEAILCRNQRLQVSETSQGFADKNRLTRVTTERM